MSDVEEGRVHGFLQATVPRDQSCSAHRNAEQKKSPGAWRRDPLHRSILDE